jgi:predicted nucleic acid-binding protein
LDTNVLFSGVLSQSGAPARLIEATVAGQFTPVVSSVVLGEFVRNVVAKQPQLVSLVALLLQSVPLEIAREGSSRDIALWRDVTFGTDAPVIAAALLAEVDYLCTGDNGIHAKSNLLQAAGLKVIRPVELLSLLGI